MYNYKLIISYDGTYYCGWAVQPNGISIQSTLNKALMKLLGYDVSISGSGRTDAGVHAEGQVAHFSTLEAVEKNAFLRSINAMTPKDIAILSCEDVLDEFHARYSARRKFYRYSICPCAVQSPFRRKYVLHYPSPLVKSLIKKALECYLGTHDFTSLANVGGNSKNKVKTIFRSELVEKEDEWHLEFEGTGFLYRMIRNMVGLVLEVGIKKRDISELPLILEGKDRRLAGKAAPAHGLSLVKVFY